MATYGHDEPCYGPGVCRKCTDEVNARIYHARIATLIGEELETRWPINMLRKEFASECQTRLLSADHDDPLRISREVWEEWWPDVPWSKYGP